MNHGKNDGVVLKLNSTGHKQWGKYFGGTNEDSLQDIRVGNDSVFVVGTTNSAPFTVGGFDAFVLRINKTDGNLIWAWAFGGTDFDSP